MLGVGTERCRKAKEIIRVYSPDASLSQPFSGVYLMHAMIILLIVVTSYCIFAQS